MNLTVGWSAEPVVVSSKSFGESIILGEILSILLTDRFKQPVVRRLGLGGTKVAFDALVSDDIHVYPDYSGTGYSMILKRSGENDAAKVFDIVNSEFSKRWGIKWSQSLGFNNTYALAVRKDDPQFKNIQKVSELSSLDTGQFRYAAPYEFMERKDGHRGFSEKYNLRFKKNNMISMSAGLMFTAIKDREVDMMIAYSTDGRIGASDLRLLEDDLSYFPPYFVSFLFKESSYKKFPALKKAINLLENKITAKEMIHMNDQVDRLKRDSYQVAKNFLIKKKMLSGHTKSEFKDMGFFSFAMSKKKYLLKIIKDHLVLSFSAFFLALLVSLPIGILLTRYQKAGMIVFPIVNTIQTIPSLALLGFLIPVVGIGFIPALIALFLYSLLPLIRNTYTGILGVDRNYLEASRGIGLNNFQILIHVELPLAMPIIIAGMRTAIVIVIATATLAALIGAGGLGDPIFRGVSTVNSNLILLGAIPSALLALIVDRSIGFLEKAVVSKGIRLKSRY